MMSRHLSAVLWGLFFFGLFSASLAVDCSRANTQEDCDALGSTCVSVLGEHCREDMGVPPCDINFSNENNEECCASNSTANIHFLGCTARDTVCMLQCVEGKPGTTAEGITYIVWQGCAFDNDYWTDVSDSKDCRSCYEDVCPELTGEPAVVSWLIIGSIVLGAVAGLILLSVAAYILYAYIRWKRIANDPERYTPMSEALIELQEIDDVSGPLSEEEGTSFGVSSDGVIQVRRMPDGTVRIPMKDGTYRYVTPEKYQQLYLKQQKKRYEEYKQSKQSQD